MNLNRKTAAIVVVASGVVATFTVVGPVSAHETGLHDNCTNFNKQFPHGVGLVTARDRVRGSTDPVTDFKRSNKLYWAAERHNSDLDRDNDRVAREKQ